MRYPILAGAAVLAVVAAGPASSQTLREMQERYCTGDAFRLCSSEIPDETRITACMARLRHMLNPQCRAVFDQSEPAAREMPAPRGKPRKPMQLVPG